jgi:hypothetical protein
MRGKLPEDGGVIAHGDVRVDEQCEVLSAIGDIASGDEGKAGLHVHVVLGLSDGRRAAAICSRARSDRHSKSSWRKHRQRCGGANGRNSGLR